MTSADKANIQQRRPINGRMLREDLSTLNVADVLDLVTTDFDQFRVASPTPLIELKSNYGLSYFRDVDTVTGSGTVTNDGSEYRLQTTANGADSATLESAERVRYVPGLGVSCGVGIRLPDTPTGNQYVEWGLSDGADGIVFGRDATGVYVALDRGGSREIKVYQDAWNGDVLDGSNTSSNPTGLALDLTRGNITEIIFAWYGYGSVRWSVKIAEPNGNSRTVFVHKAKVDGSVSINDPNLPISVKVDNDGTAATFNAYVGGRQATVIGNYTPNRRLTSEYRLERGSIDTAYVPLISFRRKSGFLGVSVKLSTIGVLPDVDMLIKVVSNGTLTGASWGTPRGHTAAETALETDYQATAITGGEMITQTIVASERSGEVATRLTLPELDFVGTDPVTLCVRRLSGSNATVSGILEVREEW